MKKVLVVAEQGFTVLSLLFFSKAVLIVILTGGTSPGDGNELSSSYPLIQLVFLIIYIITFLLLIKHWKQLLNLFIKEKFILLLLVNCCCLYSLVCCAFNNYKPVL